MKRIVPVLFIFFALFAFNGISIANAHPTVPENVDQDECIPIDFVLLVDQTGSDSTIRMEAVKWFIGMLGYDRISSCPDTIHRVAVISYGGMDAETERKYLQISLPLQAIDPLVSSGIQGWASQRAILLSDIDTEEMPYRDTNLAFEEAASLLRNAPPGVGQNRKQVIVLISDNGGMPCTEDSLCTFTSAKSYRSNLSETIEDKLPFQVDIGPYIYFITDPINFIDGQRTFDIDKELESVVKTNDGIYFEIEKSSDIARHLMEIYLSYNPKSDIQQLGCAEFDVDPFLKQLNFYTFRESTEAAFDISFEDNGIRYNITNAETNKDIVQISDPSRDKNPQHGEYFFFKRPIPGNWRIDIAGNCSNNLIYMMPFYADQLSVISPLVNLIQYNQDGNTYDPQNEVHLQFTLPAGESDSTNIKEYENFAATIEAEVISPINHKSYSLDFDFTDGVFTSIQALPVDEVGDYTYTIKLNADSKNPASFGTRNLINYESGIYHVGNVVPFTFKIESPSSTKVQVHKSIPNAFTYEDLDISIRILNENEEGIPGSTLIRGNQNQAIEASLTNVDTGESKKIHLKPAVDDPAVFSETIIGDSIGAGEYFLEITFNGEVADPTKYQLLQKPVEQNLIRRDTLFSSPITYTSLLAILASAMLIGLGILIYQHTEPIKGVLVFNRIRPQYSDGVEKDDFIELFQFDLEKNHRRKVSHQFKEGISPLLQHIEQIDAEWNKDGDGVDVSMTISNLTSTVDNTFIPEKTIEKIPGGIFVTYKLDKELIEPTSPNMDIDITEQPDNSSEDESVNIEIVDIK